MQNAKTVGNLHMKFIPRQLKLPKDSFFLFGPRGTGKSTWITHLTNCFRIDLLNSELERIYSAKPERLIEDVRRIKPGSYCCIDEVQRVPELLSNVHLLIEEGCGVYFILTGSSARKLRTQVTNLLGGRALLRHMGPFLASELKEEFSIEKALKIGLVPLIWEAMEPLEKLKTYVGVYLKEEVKAEGLVRNLGDFARFMEVLSFSQAQLLNVSNIAKESHIQRTTVDNYLQILEDLFLSFTLPVFNRRAQREVVTHPKFYYFDVGIYRHLRPKGPLDQVSELEGHALEGLVAQHLRSWILAQVETHQFAFWRTRTGLEVDFIIYGPRGFWAIEVKRNSHLSPDDVKGIKTFQKEYPEAQCCIVYGGSRKEKYHDILCIPAEEFLRSIDPEHPLQIEEDL